MSSDNNSSSSVHSSECNLVFDAGNCVSPVPEEAYQLFDSNVYSLGSRLGMISCTDTGGKPQFSGSVH